MRKLILIMLVAMLLVPMAMASDEDLTYKQSQNIDLKVGCRNNGTYCSTSAICNLTLVSPDTSTIVENERMTNKYSYHNYTLPMLDVIGTYNAAVDCCDNGDCNTKNFKIQIGALEPFPYYIIVIMLLAWGMLLFSFIFKNNIILFFASLLFLAFGQQATRFGIMGTDNIVTHAIALVHVGIGMWIIIKSAIDLYYEMS